MNRADGFPIADIDTGLFHDPKVIALSRRLRDPIQTTAHVTLYAALVLESWSQGARATLEEAAPAWWTDPVDAVAENLVAVGLIDADGRIPEHAWEAWYRPAWERREKRRASGAEGGRRSWDKRRSSDAEPTPNPTVLPTVPSAPSVVASPDAGRFEAPAPACDRCRGPLGSNPRRVYMDGRFQSFCGECVGRRLIEEKGA